MLNANGIPFFTPLINNLLAPNPKGEKATNINQQWLQLLEKQNLLLDHSAPHDENVSDSTSLKIERIEEEPITFPDLAAVAPPLTTEKSDQEHSQQAPELVDSNVSKTVSPFPSLPSETFSSIKPQLNKPHANVDLVALPELTYNSKAAPSTNKELLVNNIRVVPSVSNVPFVKLKPDNVEDSITPLRPEKKTTPQKGEAENYKKHYISISKMSDGYTIWARDYRINEKNEMKRNLLDLRGLLLASGVKLKSVVMNGEKLK